MISSESSRSRLAFVGLYVGSALGDLFFLGESGLGTKSSSSSPLLEGEDLALCFPFPEGELFALVGDLAANGVCSLCAMLRPVRPMICWGGVFRGDCLLGVDGGGPGGDGDFVFLDDWRVLLEAVFPRSALSGSAVTGVNAALPWERVVR